MARPGPYNCLIGTFTLIAGLGSAHINRADVVRRFNPTRNASSESTPLQVGNGDFAFGADITGLQTFRPFNSLSSWCWHNSSLPAVDNQTEPSDFTGLDWLTNYERLVNYAQPNPAEANISQWMIANPNRVNLGAVGLWFGSDANNVTEADLEGKHQTLDQYSGILDSQSSWKNESIRIRTMADPGSSTVAIEIESKHLMDGSLGIFFDFPYMVDVNKFEAPFVGIWNATANHTTTLVRQGHHQARIQHDEDGLTYYTTIHWDAEASISGPMPDTHRYVLKPQGCDEITLTVSYHDRPSEEMAPYYSPQGQGTLVNTAAAPIKSWSTRYWSEYWEKGAFVDLTQSGNESALELQRRVIQTQYLLAVNGAGFDPPQESGLTNNGWYGKFHAEMWLWHLGHWARWGRWSLLNRSMPGTYERFLASSTERAESQGYKGARWPKMTDPTGRSAPGEINSLLIWQQPHPMQFAEYEYRSFPNNATLQKWDEILCQTADFMASYAHWNESTCVYDLGPPLYPSSENTDPNATINTMFELSYWQTGLRIASDWQTRQGKAAPDAWTHVADNLAPLPTADAAYVIYEAIPDMWTTPAFTEDHPSMLGVYGWLPPPPTGFNLTVMENTAAHVYSSWNFTYSFGWDFPMLAMNAARLGDVERAVDFLLDPVFLFDDAGFQVGGARVATPYMPGGASLMWAVAMMAGGWDGEEAPGPHFPEQWGAVVEGFVPAL